mmetsp:Transcript_13271/g.19093  ORF Transcript_13271/g.19093 Transcript_13271/m.19093 type:complete len:91 (+) Transcript_13271:1133-1405(+)
MPTPPEHNKKEQPKLTQQKSKWNVRANIKIQLSPHFAATLAHYALHSNAMNPVTDQIAEYSKLSCCSKGHLYIVVAYRPKNPTHTTFASP